MRPRSAATVPLLVVALGIAAAAQPPGGQAPRVVAGFKASPPRFTDPARRQKLAGAFGEIDRAVRQFLSAGHVPGAAWAVVIDGELAHLGTSGTRQAGAGAPVDGDTVFRIASMTKSFTAMAILGLRDDGKLSLDDPAERYVPELRGLTYPTADSPRITVRHLLSHAAGFPEDNPWGDQQLAATEDEFSAMLRGGIPFSNPPGLAYEYSNLGFAILGRIVSGASGMPYREYIASRILRPLGMASTTLEASEVPPDRLAHGYRWEDETWKEEPPLPDGAFGSMGGMLTSVRDLSRYVAAFLEAWPPRDGAETAPIRRASLREMQQVWRTAARGGRTGLRRQRSTSRPAATGSACASPRAASTARSCRTAEGCPGSDRSCDGCRSTALASSGSAAALTRAGTRWPTRRSRCWRRRAGCSRAPCSPRRRWWRRRKRCPASSSGGTTRRSSGWLR